MKIKQVIMATLLAAALSRGAQAQPLVNLGLVGVGRLSGDSFDQLGANVDTLGGIFSGMWLDPSSIVHSNGTIHATVFGLPDRGFGDGLQDYHPRIQKLAVAITPYYGPGPVPQDQIVIVNTDTFLLTVNGSTFTGFQPDDTNVLTHPQSLPGSLGGGKWSLDSEGIGFVPGSTGGTWYISDEYGPFIYRFDNTGALLGTLPVPDAYIPRVGTNYPRKIDYLTGGLITVATDSGRYNNRGMEGLSVTPDGKRLVACIQSPLTQDGENRNPSRNTRILVYDIDSASPTYNTAIAEYVHVLPLSAAEANNRHTPVSEILAFSDKRFLILQRDSRGLGGDAGAFLYKRIVEVDASNASNILGTGYDLEKGAPGQISLPRAGLPSNVVAVTSRDLVDIINPTQLAKYGLNLAPSNQNINTVSEKWEGTAVIPLNDPAAPNDYLLLVGNDNDFRAPVVYHNGVAVGTNEIFSDNVLLAFRIGADSTPPTIVCPAPRTVAAGTNCAATVDLRSAATASDNSAAPITISQSPSTSTPLGLGTHTITLIATDAAGNQSAPCTTTVTVADVTIPIITSVTPSRRQLWPPNNKMVPITIAVTGTDNCSSTLTCEIVSITSNESEGRKGKKSDNKKGDSRKLPIVENPGKDDKKGGDDNDKRGSRDEEDWEITGPLSANLRAQRLGTGDGRFYVITVRCTDEAGNSSTGVATVFVPKNASDLETGFRTSIHPYTVPVGPDYSIIPVLSAGDRVPRTRDASQSYQMVGIPDGLGAYANKDGTTTLFMNHELVQQNRAEPIIGQPLTRGAFVSKLVLAPDSSVLSGDVAFTQVHVENTFYGPAPSISNSTPAFARFCSGNLEWKEAGFDRPIYFCGEESSGTNTFDGKGGSVVAIFNDSVWTLPRLGHLSWENAVVRPDKGLKTAVMCLEDGELEQCQLYMYVGTKDYSRHAGPLARNGLDNGSLYVFVATPGSPTNEAGLPNGSVWGNWVRLPGAANMTDVELEAAADAVGAFAFDRIEDGAFRSGNPNHFYFDTTGGSVANPLGRLYHLTLNRFNLLGPAQLSVVFNAAEVIAAGGDIAISPDNIGASNDYLMINEDGTAQSRVVMAAKERNGNIWRLNLHTGVLDNVAELFSIGRDGIVTTPGNWETTGIIPTKSLFGADSWLFNVQAHPPTRAPGQNTVEDGQLLLMIRNR